MCVSVCVCQSCLSITNANQPRCSPLLHCTALHCCAVLHCAVRPVRCMSNKIPRLPCIPRSFPLIHSFSILAVLLNHGLFLFPFFPVRRSFTCCWSSFIFFSFAPWPARDWPILTFFSRYCHASRVIHSFIRSVYSCDDYPDYSSFVTLLTGLTTRNTLVSYSYT